MRQGGPGWILDAESGKVTLLDRKIEEFLTLVEIPATQRRMVRKDLECLVGKLRSMHLAVPGAVGSLFHIQRVLNQGGGGPGVDISGLPSQACGLEGDCPSSGVQSDAPGRNRPLETHPYRVM